MKKNIQSLALEKKGCAFADNKSSPTFLSTVVISLGGLGAQTLNKLKGKFTREVGECDHIWFRMIDSDEAIFNDYCMERPDGMLNDSPDAHMESGEMIHLYDQSLRDCLAPTVIPAYIDKWLNPALKGREIRPDGAQMTRQIGRAMLLNHYERVRHELEISLIGALHAPYRRPINIILIAGVSGGTGGGTVIDVSYMIHDLMNQYHASTNYTLAGYIFTPDAQFFGPVTYHSPENKAALERNGYAALKEIDYFMDLEETGSVYRLQLRDRTIECTRNIFDSCTLVSGYNEAGYLRETADIISCLTDHLMDMLTDTRVRMTYHMSQSIMSNDHAFIDQWFYHHPERRYFHRYVPYKYQVLGYNSIRVPRDEIFAYCVDRIYEGVLKEFKNFRIVNRQMLGRVYEAAHIQSPARAAAYAAEAWRVERTLHLDGYNKGMVRSNPMIAYYDACEVSQSEARKINDIMMTKLENDIYSSLKKQIDLIFDQYGPYVAMRAIQHESDRPTDDGPNEPFFGVYEQLIKLSAAMTEQEAAYRRAGNADLIRAKADNATRLFSRSQDMAEYVSECCSQAVERYLNPVLYNALSKVLLNVAARMNDYNSKLFSVYTAIMDEVQYILSRDGDYFSRRMRARIGTKELYSVDLFHCGAEHADRFKKYLDEFIDRIPVHALAQNYIRSMRDNKEKWLGQPDERNFDVAGEVRTLMDDCLSMSNIVPRNIEKFIAAAFYPDPLTPAQLDVFWFDDAQDGPKMQALNAAAHYILQTLEDGAKTMACSGRMIPLDEFGKKYYFGELQDTPTLSGILAKLLYNRYNPQYTRYHPHISVSNTRDRFIYTARYYGLPMYILKGMGEYNEQYVRNPALGMHLDEKDQDWSRFQNPFTIDSVALDIMNEGKQPSVIDTYPDRIILDEVEKQTRYGLQAGYVKVEQIPAADTRLTLHEISAVPDDMERFKQELYDEALHAHAEEREVDIITFMSTHGFELDQVLVSAGDTDIDLGLMDFENASAQDKYTKYRDIPVPVEDIYKWLRKSIRYMDILEKDYMIFKELEQVLKEAAKES